MGRQKFTEQVPGSHSKTKENPKANKKEVADSRQPLLHLAWRN